MDHPVLTPVSARAHHAAMLCCLVAGVVMATVAGCAGGSDRAPSSGTGGAGTATGGASATGGTSGGTGGSFGSGGGAVSTGGSSAGSGGITGTGGAATGGAGGAAACLIDVSLLPPQNVDSLFSGKNSRVRVRATVPLTDTNPPRWRIEYLDGPGPENVPLDPDVVNEPPSTSTADFPTTLNGHYAITVSAGPGITCRDGHLEFTVNPPQADSFTLRVTPPAGKVLDFPAQDIHLDPGAFAVFPGRIALARGTRRGINLMLPDQTYVPAYVRVSLVASDLKMEGYTGPGPAVVSFLPKSVYDLLVIPEGDVAPYRFSASLMDHSITEWGRLPIDRGVLVTGSVLNSDGTPMPGARVLLRDDIRPSTMGVSDAAGKFQLWTRPGVASALVVAPAGSGLPEARVASLPGVVVNGNLSALTLTWDSFVRGAFEVMVRSTDGTAPVAGARVHVESPVDAKAHAGTLRVTGLQTVALPAMGGVRLDADTDASGRAVFPNLPVAPYTITVVPPPSAIDAALTTRWVTLTAAGLSTTIPLARHITLAGTLLPVGMTKGVRIVARDHGTGLVAPPVSAIVDAQGRYALSVDPERLYELVAEPPPGSGLALTVLDIKRVGTVAPSALSYPVAAAFPFTGQVVEEGADNLTIGGALVQVYCVPSPTCKNSEIAVAETITSADGTFTVSLPAPLPHNAP